MHCKYQYTSLIQKHNVDNMQTLTYANGSPVGSINMKHDMHCFHLLFWKELHWVLIFVIILVIFLLIQLAICFLVFSLDLIGILHF